MGSVRRQALSIIRRLPHPLDTAVERMLRLPYAWAHGRAKPIPRRPNLQDLLEKAFESRDERRIRRTLAEVHAVRARAEALASPAWVPDGVRLSETYGIQSMQFMIDLLPHIQRLLAQHPRGSRFDVLDVGPGTGHGTALLAALYRRPSLGYQMRVSGLDISRLYAHYIPAITPYVSFIQEDVFRHGHTYDIVIASHVIEHLTDPISFCRRLQELARLAVFIVAPFNEPAGKLTTGHVGVINDEIVKQLEPAAFTIMNSVSWGAFENPPYEMLVAQLNGKASPKTPWNEQPQHDQYLPRQDASLGEALDAAV